MIGFILVPDMQAFKAANPHAVIEDFVRWHSPRDWITDVDEEDNPLSTGKLSIRMSEPGNLWQELWKVCHSPPIMTMPNTYLFIYYSFDLARTLFCGIKSVQGGFRRVDKNHCLTMEAKEKR